MDHKTVVFNEAKMNFDGNLDFSVLSPEVVTYSDTTPDQFLERAADAKILVTKEMPVSREQILALPDSVKLICEAGTGYNNLDLDAAREKGITVCNIPAYSSERVAHTAIMIGAGNIGRTVMKIAKALDMNILVYTRTPKDDEENVHYADLETVLKNSDYISLHCPLTPATRHLINADTLEMMKPTAFLINTSRGALVDEPALIQALKEHKIAGAGLDVQETEPPVEDNPLYTLDNVILTPHMGWKGLETRQRLLHILKGNIDGFINGKPVNVVS